MEKLLIHALFWKVLELTQKKEDLISRLADLTDTNIDPEIAHIKADELLIEFINDKDIANAFDGITKYYV